MSTFPFAMIVSQSALSREFAGAWNGEQFEFASALPTAPVTDDGRGHRRPRTRRARSALAAALHRAAEAVAPAPAVECRTAR